MKLVIKNRFHISACSEAWVLSGSHRSKKDHRNCWDRNRGWNKTPHYHYKSIVSSHLEFCMQFLFSPPHLHFRKKKHYIQKRYREGQKSWSKVWNSFYPRRENRLGFITLKGDDGGKGMIKRGWMSFWRGDNYWIFFITPKLGDIKRNFRAKESSFLFTT